MEWLWWAPLVTTALHVVEEFVYPGGFAAWDRRYRPAIRESISRRLHIFINTALLLLCLQIAILAGTGDAEAIRIALLAWLAVSALLFSNAIFHVLGTIRTATYSPGLVTATALYVPLAVMGYWHFLSAGQVSLPVAAAAASVGGSYHFWASLLHRVRTHSATGDAAQEQHDPDDASRRDR